MGSIHTAQKASDREDSQVKFKNAINKLHNVVLT